MRYMLLVYADERGWKEGEQDACYVESAQLCRELDGKGQFLAANPLQSVATATSVRLRNGKQIVTDGPFAETREQLGGFFLVNVDNLDEALAIAKCIPAARKGTVEIRPLLEIQGLPGN